MRFFLGQVFFAYAIFASASLSATTFVPQTEEDLIAEAEILCAVEIGKLQFIIKEDRVFTRAPIRPIECFAGDLSSNAVLEWPGGQQSFTHESGTTETITTRVPGLPVIKAGEQKILSLKRDPQANLPLFHLQNWQLILDLEEHKNGELFIRQPKINDGFLPSPAKKTQKRIW